MRLRIYSDLHLETNTFSPQTDGCDTVILAGDIHEGDNGVLWARDSFPSVPVVYVAGNHEHYGQPFAKVQSLLCLAAADSNVQVLQRAAYHIGPVRFLGCTLWSDFELLNTSRESSIEAQRRGLDYQAIRIDHSRRFRPADAIRDHRTCVDWLWHELEQPHNGPTVIITHHAPSAQSLPGHYLDRPRSAAYASHLDELVEQSGASLWIHGHIHSRSDYWIGDTRVLCNPLGTGDESVREFDPGLTVDVD